MECMNELMPIAITNELISLKFNSSRTKLIQMSKQKCQYKSNKELSSLEREYIFNIIFMRVVYFLKIIRLDEF